MFCRKKYIEGFKGFIIIHYRWLSQSNSNFDELLQSNDEICVNQRRLLALTLFRGDLTNPYSWGDR